MHGPPGAGGPHQPHGVPIAPSSAPTMFVPAAPQGGPGVGGPGGRPMQQPFSPNAGAFNAGSGAGMGPMPGMGPGPGPMPFALPGKQMAPMPAPLGQPYLVSQAASYTARPIEPCKDRLRTVMFIWGGALHLVFDTHASIDPLVFNWHMLFMLEGKEKLPPFVMLAIGLAHHRARGDSDLDRAARPDRRLARPLRRRAFV